MSASYRIVILNIRRYPPMYLTQALQESGHEVLHFFFAGLDEAGLASTLAQIEAFKPHFCFQMFYDLFDRRIPAAEEVEHFFIKRNIPVISWFSDDPEVTFFPKMQEVWDSGYSPSNGFFICVNAHHAEFFKKRNRPVETLFMPAYEKLPYFAHQSGAQETFSQNVSFSGTAVPLEGLDLKQDLKTLHKSYYFIELEKSLRENHSCSEVEIAKAKRDLLPHVDRFFSQWFSTPSDYAEARGRFLSDIETFSDPLRKYLRYNFPYLSHAYSYFHMSTFLKDLLPEGLELYGAPWNKLFNLSKPTRWLDRNEFHSLCGLSKISLSYSKWQLRDTFNERVGTTFALGGFPLSDHRAQIDELFEKDEIATYRTTDEARDKIRYYLSHETERKKIIEKGRSRVLNCYTFKHFGNKIIEFARDRWKIIS